jgi:hypothetical protein
MCLRVTGTTFDLPVVPLVMTHVMGFSVRIAPWSPSLTRVSHGSRSLYVAAGKLPHSKSSPYSVDR